MTAVPLWLTLERLDRAMATWWRLATDPAAVVVELPAANNWQMGNRVGPLNTTWSQRTAPTGNTPHPLRAGLRTRELIGQAVGILIERERITPDQAFRMLVRASQDLNVKLRDVAQTLVDTGETGATPRRRPPKR